MAENPYKSPNAAGVPKAKKHDIDPQWRGFVGRKNRSMISLDRPIGVTIACCANMIIPLAALVLFMCMDSVRLMGVLGYSELCPSIFMVSFFVASAASMASSIGMWDGAKWSWWTMTFLQMYCFMAGIGDTVLRSVFFLSKAFTPLDVVHLARGIAYSSLWILYFYTDDVLAFFEQDQGRKLLRGSCIFLVAGIVVAIELSLEIALRTVPR